MNKDTSVEDNKLDKNIWHALVTSVRHINMRGLDKEDKVLYGLFKKAFKDAGWASIIDKTSGGMHELLMAYGKVCEEEGILSDKAVTIRMDIASYINYLESTREIERIIVESQIEELKRSNVGRVTNGRNKSNKVYMSGFGFAANNLQAHKNKRLFELENDLKAVKGLAQLPGAPTDGEKL